MCVCVCVCVCVEQQRVTVSCSTGLPGTETHLGWSFSSEEARGGGSSRLTPCMAHIFTPLSELLSGLSLAGGLAASPFLQARQIATNHWHQRNYPMALTDCRLTLAYAGVYVCVCLCVLIRMHGGLLSVQCVWA